MAQLGGCHPTNQNVAGLTPGQGTCPGFGFGSYSALVQEATSRCFSLTLIFLSLSLSPSLSLSLKSTSMSSGEDLKKEEEEKKRKAKEESRSCSLSYYLELATIDVLLYMLAESP